MRQLLFAFVVLFLAPSRLLGAGDDVQLDKQGTATADHPAHPSGRLIFEGSRWDSKTRRTSDITSSIELRPGGDSGIEPSHTLNLNNVDALNIKNSSGFPWMRFFQGQPGPDHPERWSEAYFISDGGFTFLLNLVNTANDKEVGIRLSKGTQPNPWVMLIPSQPGCKFAIIRDALVDAFVLDEDGRCIIGRLPPNDYGPPQGRFHVRGMVDEIQTVVEADASQTADIFEVTNRGRTAKHLLVDAQGNVGIGTAKPMARLDVNGTICQRGKSLHADYVFDKDYGLESIEDHAKQMWREKHLPAIAPRQVDDQGREVLHWGTHQRAILEELEKAHIYIEQLNARTKKLEMEIAELRTQLERAD